MKINKWQIYMIITSVLMLSEGVMIGCYLKSLYAQYDNILFVGNMTKWIILIVFWFFNVLIMLFLFINVFMYHKRKESLQDYISTCRIDKMYKDIEFFKITYMRLPDETE